MTPAPAVDSATAILGKLRSAPIERRPFPHVLVEELLPQSDFEELAASIPPLEMWSAADNRRKLDLDITEAGSEFSRLPESTRASWLRARDTFFRGVIVPALVEQFGAAIRAKYELLFGRKLTDELMAGGFTSTHGRLMARKVGYKLRPHTDSAQLAVTCLLYFCSGADLDHGALCLYSPERTPQLKHASTYYPRAEEGIRATLVKTIELKPNLFVAFLNGASSLHGLRLHREHVDAGFTRICYQAHVILRSLRIATLLPRLDAARRARWQHRDESESY